MQALRVYKHWRGSFGSATSCRAPRHLVCYVLTLLQISLRLYVGIIRLILYLITSLHFLILKKNKRRLMRSPCCLGIPLIFVMRFMRSSCCCVCIIFRFLYGPSNEGRRLVLPRTSCLVPCSRRSGCTVFEVYISCGVVWYCVGSVDVRLHDRPRKLYHKKFVQIYNNLIIFR
jgi:hypothetical protein